MEDFEIGDVVQLRSGGPKMTVHGLVSDGDVVCQWFEGNEVHEESFLKEALRKVELVTAGGSRRADGVFMGQLIPYQLSPQTQLSVHELVAANVSGV